MSMIVMLAMMMAMIFMGLSHPITLGGILITQTMLISLITGLMNTNFWCSYILFLIMIGGMLILFAYMTSIASNEKFKFSQKITLLILVMLILSAITSIIDPMETLYPFKMNEFYKQPQNTPLMMNKYLNFPMNLLFITLVTYLLITMMAIVTITKTNQGPLRHKN